MGSNPTPSAIQPFRLTGRIPGSDPGGVSSSLTGAANTALSSKGRTPDFDSAGAGSNPAGAASMLH